MKSINYRFWIVKVLKTINNRLITILNRMDRLKHRMEIIFGRYTKKISEINLKSKINYRYRIGGTNRCITLNRRRLSLSDMVYASVQISFKYNEIMYHISTMLCLFNVNSKAIEIAVQPSRYFD